MPKNSALRRMLGQDAEKWNNLFERVALPIWQRSGRKKGRMEVQSQQEASP
jgi:hypothetical protein